MTQPAPRFDKRFPKEKECGYRVERTFYLLFFVFMKSLSRTTGTLDRLTLHRDGTVNRGLGLHLKTSIDTPKEVKVDDLSVMEVDDGDFMTTRVDRGGEVGSLKGYVSSIRR